MKGPTWLMWVCVSEKINLKKKKKRKQCQTYIWCILCIQNNLPNTLKCENESFFIYSISVSKYKKEILRNETPLFETKQGLS